LGKLLKRIGRNPVTQRLLGAAAAGLIQLVKRTTRWRIVNEGVAAPAWAGTQPVIIAFWHNRLTMMPVCWPSAHPFHMLISSHPDGQLIARAIGHFGFDSVAGSSTRGGTDAVRTLVRLIKGGASVGITPDGPRGPRMRATDGIVALARLANVPILPVGVSVKRRVVLNTWDRLIISLPFNSGGVVWGAPLTVTAETDMGAARMALETELNRVSAEADMLAGHPPMTPAPLTSTPSQETADASA